jgi:hypothetical protein
MSTPAAIPSGKKFLPVTGEVAAGTTADVGVATAKPGSLLTVTTALPVFTTALVITNGEPVLGYSITFELAVIELATIVTVKGAANVPVRGCPVDGLTTSIPTPAPSESLERPSAPRELVRTDRVGSVTTS